MSTRGFTLVEAVVVVSLTSLVMGVLGSLLVSFYKTNAYVLQDAQATLEARRGVVDAVRTLREASYATDGSYPVLIATATKVSVSADVNNDGDLDTVTYEQSGTTLLRTTTLAGQSPTTATISSFVANTGATPLFQYLDVTGATLGTPVDRSRIAAVQMTVQIELDPNRSPNAFTLSGNATLRNSRL